MAVSTATTVAELQALQAAHAGKAFVLFFWADFHEPSKPGGQMDVLFTTLAGAHSGMGFVKVAAEEADDLADQFDIAAVPTFVFLRGKSVVDKLQGADPAQLAALITKHSKALPVRDTKAELNQRLAKLTNSAHVLLFMKGNPSEPKCKFSRAMVELLGGEGVEYATFNILEDDAVRQGLKEYAKWPTYPQLWVGGKLLGGLDIVREMKEDGDLVEALAPRAAAVPSTGSGAPAVAAPAPEPVTEERLKALTTQSRVMLFMKGVPAAPECGFSSKMVGILNAIPGLEYGTFNILTDPGVRAALKEYAKWPTYPQLWVGGNLLGGLDVIKELQEDGELEEELGLSA